MMANFFDKYYWVYVLQSLKDGKKYTGYTNNLPSRFEAHQNGEVESTRNRRPFKLIYFEACLNKEDALKREKYSPYEIKSKILMQGIISQGKKRITENYF